MCICICICVYVYVYVYVVNGRLASQGTEQAPNAFSSMAQIPHRCPPLGEPTCHNGRWMCIHAVTGTGDLSQTEEVSHTLNFKNCFSSPWLIQGCIASGPWPKVLFRPCLAGRKLCKSSSLHPKIADIHRASRNPNRRKASPSRPDNLTLIILFPSIFYTKIKVCMFW